MGTAAARRPPGSSHGLCLAGDGSPLPSPPCTAPGTAEAGGLWAGRAALFLQRSFCSMEKHILKL